MPHIARGDRGAPRERDAGDLCVAHIYRAPSTLTVGSERGRFRCSSGIEIKHTVLKVFLQKLRERRLK